MEAIKENWTTIKEAVRREYSLSDISYHTWVEPLEFHNVVNDVVSIIIPSDQAHALNYISSKYKSFFQVTIILMISTLSWRRMSRQKNLLRMKWLFPIRSMVLIMKMPI